MTALRLLNNEIVIESKHGDGRNEDFKDQNLHEEETPWVTVRDNKTMPRNKKRSVKCLMEERYRVSYHKRQRTTVIVGDSIIKNIHGIKLVKTVGYRVVVKPFPGATICDMHLHVVPTIEKAPDKNFFTWGPTI